MKKKGKIKVEFDVEIWKDKSSKSYIVYSKKYDISGYGRTIERAKKTFEFNVKEYLKHTKP